MANSPGEVILATSDVELTEPLWSRMAVSLLTGIVLLVIGLGLEVTRTRSTPSPA